ncbi:nickel ABC transporter ATP-binding protein [Thalassospira sp. MCCC 1A01428]|nr:nickel ABC transporter ATP-binding protein [Thalassospira sp. MCCC 1A01428]
MSLLSAQNVSHGYRSFSLLGRSRYHPVLGDVSMEIGRGETLALLGRSGCGKSTLARLLIGLETPMHGDIRFERKPLNNLSQADRLALRCAVQMVFQDSISAVNPRKTVGEIVAEPLRHLTDMTVAQQSQRVVELLESVELSAEDAEKRPATMSGGQLQRVCIARALAPKPALVILDEAVSNLDLLLQIQTLDLLRGLQEKSGLSFLFITHDLRLVERFCSRVMVMDGGRIVEEVAVRGEVRLEHPASKQLQDAILPAWPRGCAKPDLAGDDVRQPMIANV